MAPACVPAADLGCGGGRAAAAVWPNRSYSAIVSTALSGRVAPSCISKGSASVVPDILGVLTRLAALNELAALCLSDLPGRWRLSLAAGVGMPIGIAPLARWNPLH